MPGDPCNKCRQAGGLERATLPSGKFKLRVACPSFDGFRTKLCEAFKDPKQVLALSEKLGIPTYDWVEMQNQPVKAGWESLLKLAAAQNKLSDLVARARADQFAQAHQAALGALYDGAACQFVEWAVEPKASTLPAQASRYEDGYLNCDRKDEWEPFTVPRREDLVVPLILLGAVDEAPELFHTRVERYAPMPATVVKWERDYHVEHMCDALQLALRQVAIGASPGDKTSALLRKAPRFALLHPVLDFDESSREANDRLKGYYARLATHLTELARDGDYRAPFVVQCIKWNRGEHRSRAERLAQELADQLAQVLPRPQIIQSSLKMIPTDEIKKFLTASGKFHLWPEISKEIHHLNWPAPLGRKPSRAVYDALQAAWAKDTSNEAHQ